MQKEFLKDPCTDISTKLQNFDQMRVSSPMSSSSLPSSFVVQTPIPFPLLNHTPLHMDSPKTRKPYIATKQRESWSAEEHQKFVEGVRLYKRDWKQIEKYVGTKTVIQIRSHAQKYFLKLQKMNSADKVPPPRPKRPSPKSSPKVTLNKPKLPLPIQSSSSSSPSISLLPSLHSTSDQFINSSAKPSTSTSSSTTDLLSSPSSGRFQSTGKLERHLTPSISSNGYPYNTNNSNFNNNNNTANNRSSNYMNQHNSNIAFSFPSSLSSSTSKQEQEVKPNIELLSNTGVSNNNLSNSQRNQSQQQQQQQSLSTLQHHDQDMLSNCLQYSLPIITPEYLYSYSPMNFNHQQNQQQQQQQCNYNPKTISASLANPILNASTLPPMQQQQQAQQTQQNQQLNTNNIYSNLPVKIASNIPASILNNLPPTLKNNLSSSSSNLPNSSGYILDLNEDMALGQSQHQFMNQSPSPSSSQSQLPNRIHHTSSTSTNTDSDTDADMNITVIGGNDHTHSHTDPLTAANLSQYQLSLDNVSQNSSDTSLDSWMEADEMLNLQSPQVSSDGDYEDGSLYPHVIDLSNSNATGTGTERIENATVTGTGTIDNKISPSLSLREPTNSIHQNNGSSSQSHSPTQSQSQSTQFHNEMIENCYQLPKLNTEDPDILKNIQSEADSIDLFHQFTNFGDD